MSLKVIADGGVEEFRDGDIVGLLLEELRDSDVILLKDALDGLIVEKKVVEGSFEELGHRDVVLLQELGGGGAQEFGHCRVQILCWRKVCLGLRCSDQLGRHTVAEEFRDADIIRLLLKELSDGDIVVGQELCDGCVQEFGHCDVVGALEELGDRDVVLQEFRHGRVEVHFSGVFKEDRRDGPMVLIVVCLLQIRNTMLDERLLVFIHIIVGLGSL